VLGTTVSSSLQKQDRVLATVPFADMLNDDDVQGLAVHIGSRVADAADPASQCHPTPCEFAPLLFPATPPLVYGAGVAS
jgi:hypothetical protein